MSSTTKTEVIYLEVKNEIATIYINRPEKRNAITYDMWLAIPNLVEQCNQNPDVKVIVFNSIGDAAFSAGADISEFRELRSGEAGAEVYTEATLVAEKAIMDTPEPTITMVRGFCVGGGCEIAVACDFRFSDVNGRFGITPAKLGIVYNTPGTKNLVDLVGASRAKDILYTGRLLDAKEALQIGLINRIFATEDIETETYKYAELLAKNSQVSIRGTKSIMKEILNGALKDSALSKKLVKDAYSSEDYKEGVSAFLEKRKPTFK